MKRMLWTLLKRAFRRCLLEDVDAVLLAAFERRLIDTCALHEMDAAFKYGHEIIRKRATFAGETRGVFHYGTGPTMAVIALAVAAFCAAAPARAEAPPCGTSKAPEWCASVVAAPLTLVTNGERREYLGGGLAVDGPLGAGFGLTLSGLATGMQDGGDLDANPKSFRAVLVEARVSRGDGWLQLAARGSASFSIEGQIGAPADSRLFDGEAEARVALDGLRVAATFGHVGSVGGLAVGAAIEVPTVGGVPIVARYVWPIVLDERMRGRRPDTLEIGVVARIKSFGLRRAQ
jgi:hypothetical protein